MLHSIVKIVICALVLVSSNTRVITKVEAFNGALFNRDEKIKSCINPNGHKGSCISIRECASLQSVLRDQNQNNYEFVRLSVCQNGSGNPPYVCCTPDTSFTASQRKQRDRIVFPDDELMSHDTHFEKNTKISKFPKPPKCGATAIGNRIYGGVETALREFPWMVNLEYRTASGKIVSVCAGSIINERYVVTAAHCIRGDIEKKVGKVVSVRVGDHNTKTENDCDKYGCIAPAQRFGIESIKVHERFDGNKELRIHQHNDIALIRLDQVIEFTDSIQPVCLPNIEDPLPNLVKGMKLTVAGWGHNGSVKSTDEKRKVALPIVDQNECRQRYSKSSKIYIADEQLCAGGVFREDSCTGDSGGPLMRLSDSSWILEGIVSFGRRCGLEEPGIYTNVRYYVEWLNQNVLP